MPSSRGSAGRQRPTARRAVARRAASRRDAAGRGARHREPGRPGAGCRTTDPGKPGSLPAGRRQSPGRPNQVPSQVRPAAGQWRGGPPGRRLPARSPGRRMAGRSPAAGSRGLCTRAGRNRGSRGRSTRERRPRVAGSRIPRQPAAPRRSGLAETAVLAAEPGPVNSCAVNSWAAESRGAVRSPRAFVGRVRVTRIPVAVIVHGRLLVDGIGAVGGLQYLPGLGVQLAETVRPGDLGSERRLLPSARAFVRIAPWP